MTAVANAGHYEITDLHGEQAFIDLRDEWDELWRQSREATQFQRWDWQYLYFQRLASRSRPRVIVARERGGACIALAVFSTVLDPYSGLPKAAFLGDLDADYHMILARHDLPLDVGAAIFDRFVSDAHAGAAYVDISNVPLGCWTANALTEYMQTRPVRSHLARWRRSETYSVPLPSRVEDYLHRLGTSTRQNLARDRRRLDREYTTEWRIYQGRDGLVNCATAIEVIDRARWGEASRYRHPAWRDFLTALGQSQTEAGISLSFVLYLDHDPVAYVTGVVIRGGFRAVATAYNPAVPSKLSVGEAIYFYSIQKCIEYGYREYDMTRGSEAYKRWLGALPHRNLHLRLYRSRIDEGLETLGNRSLTILRGIPTLRRLHRRLVRGQV